ncbi:Protein phosphatase Slingshot [Orchesella cincta]|uniref:protein-serine/threonine phosphatase n=1 Tax=Orchesella cincta TaxID=48709 RepID=A0A1D2MGI5_ORCCI|nr:Protein phosphatase Slingshot [Orchesella cincta]
MGSVSHERNTMPEIEKHLHQLHHLLREQDSIKLVRLVPGADILPWVSCVEQECEEYCVLGIDCEKSISLGLVLAILSHTTIRLDGDGGFSITNGDGLRSHIFKPVSVQTMWTALQSLYQASECAKKNNSYQVYAVNHYTKLFQTYRSDPACLNEWNALPGVEVRRPMTSQMTSEEITLKEKISSALREILLNEKDLDEVTSKEIRTKLETKLQIDFSKISCILNVTAEIDNFFPDMFRYMNIPVIDNEETDLLRYFNDSYRFISQALKEDKNVLVHCKMGISRSATIVIAYVMKTRNWDLPRSLEHVKKRRTCVKPNPHFMKQLEVYEGILAAKRYSSTLEKRSKSESNLKQSDIALSTPKERNFSSSNNDIIISGNEVKSPRKYYNTAPARLKPEKSGKICGDLLRPKSCSCATISMSSTTPFNDIVPPEVMDSFTEAVRNLEQQSLPPDCRLNCPDTPAQKPENQVEVPIVKIFDDSQSDCNMDTEEIPLPEPMNEAPSPVELPEEVPDGLNVKTLELNILPTLEEKPDDPKSPTSQDSDSSSRKNINSKFSVRRLVNEFESQSNRQLNSLLASIPDSNNTVNNIEHISPNGITRSNSRVKSWVMNDAEPNNSAGRITKTMVPLKVAHTSQTPTPVEMTASRKNLKR